jgi:predicted DNA-binding transcriptional regulator YafY
MRRAERLFEILQVLRRAKGPLTAQAIADTLETSRRTVYRDLGAMMAQRVPIRSEAGIGYELERGFDLPPLMLTTDELEAMVLGAQWVAAHGDAGLAKAAADVLAKIAAVVPPHLRVAIDDPVIGVPPGIRAEGIGLDVGRLREWSRSGRKLAVRYIDEAGTRSERVVWPFMVGYVAGVQALMAWCELRSDFRVFRIDRIESLDFLTSAAPTSVAALRRQWLAQERRQKAMQDEVKRLAPDARTQT